jgi:hypothetical protein
MKVKELIEQLKHYPEDLEVIVSDYYGYNLVENLEIIDVYSQKSNKLSCGDFWEYTSDDKKLKTVKKIKTIKLS